MLQLNFKEGKKKRECLYKSAEVVRMEEIPTG